MHTNSDSPRLSALPLLALLAVALLWAPRSWALSVFACEPEYAALVSELAPEASVYSATTALQDPHQIQARPSLIAKVRRADLLVCAGAELEVGWLPMLQMKANNPKARDGQPGMFYAAEQVETLDQLTQVDRTMGDVHADGNPHLQFSPSRMLAIAEALTERLAQVDPQNAEAYRTNLADFRARWQAAIPRWEAQAAPLKGKKVIAYHTSFRYLFDWLGMEQVGDLEPKPGLPPTTGHLATLLKRADEGDLMAVIHTGYQDSRGAQWLADRAALPRVRLPFGPGEEGIADLFALYDRVIAQLVTVAEAQ
ncbi:metal ABC transporter solute-binding protein, Zn/Mn family [Ferrimonas balearica]|uniref:metal ABC transporter solute-binding protein, Zn/Mn family n=1 Tax=Ferrimonas balearica TaxID=44012 RepID=UPI001C99B7FE|nr:zinc ABC transporter substrate-binding protein [Ferrimonas balearica]MBY5992277.1 zinc ABC transporter substrate-binding protein [Ferrimonas balearica]